MKHILNMVKIISLFTIQIFFMIIGFIVVPLALLFNRIEDFETVNEASRPNRRFKDRWIDRIWGNEDDGIEGDTYYLIAHVKYKRNFFTRCNWVLLRNPVHNLGMKIGFNNIAVEHIGKRISLNNSCCETKEFYNDYENCLDSKLDKQGIEYTEVTDIDNKVYVMYRVRVKYPYINYGVKCNIGWKNWNVHKVGEHYRYTFTFLINPFKKFK